MEQDCCLALPVLGRYIEARKEDTLSMKDRSINPFALLGVVVWNSIFFVSIALGLLGIVLATWILTVSCLFAPLVLVAATMLGQPWDWWQTLGSLGLCLIGVSVFPLAKMMSRTMVRTTRLYYRYNHQALYR